MWQTLFRPAIGLMGRLSFARKMMLIAAVFTLPIAGCLFIIVRNANEDIAFARNELQGAEYLTPTNALLQHVQQHRGAAAGYLGGDHSFAAVMKQKQQAIEEDIRKVDEVDRRCGEAFKVSSAWKEWKQSWQQLIQQVEGLTTQQSLQKHTELIERLLALRKAVAKGSELVLDPHYDGYYTIQAVVFTLPQHIEVMGQARAIGTLALSSGSLQRVSDHLIALRERFVSTGEDTNHAVQTAIDANPSLQSRLAKPVQEAQAKEAAFLDDLNTLIAGNTASYPSAKQYFDRATAAIDAQYNLLDTLQETLTALLQERVREKASHRFRVTVLALLPALFAAWLFFGFYWGSRAQIRDLLAASEKLAQGDVQVSLQSSSKDELAQVMHGMQRVTVYLKQLADASQQIAQGDLRVQVKPVSDRDALGNAFATMAQSLRDIVQRLRDNASQVSSTAQQLSASTEQSGQASHEIARGSEQLAQQATEAARAMDNLDRAIRTVQQGSEAQREAAQQAEEGMRQAAKAVEEVARSAQQMAASAQQASAIAQQGGQSVEEMLRTMRQIQQQAEASAEKVAQLDQLGQQIGNIVQTIEQIAEQTNLLALNAAIEAARAGEHGRGFAVVADEVRKLAEQSSAATKEIAVLIGNVRAGVEETVRAIQSTSEMVNGGFARSEQVGSALTQIIEAAQQVAGEVQSVTAVAEEMSASVQQVLATVSTVLQSAEENARAALEMASGSEQVSSAIASVASISEEAAASAEELNASSEEVAAAAQELAGMAQQLQALVSQFRYEETDSRSQLRLAA
jgi:methyl-accepting chemotaxis protein